jgi:hypothetical protein
MLILCKMVDGGGVGEKANANNHKHPHAYDDFLSPSRRGLIGTQKPRIFL